MTIPTLPALSRTSATFKAEVDTFFGTSLPAFSTAVNAEVDRLNAIGYGSYNATSTTSLTIGTGSKSLTIETAKGYVAGQAVLIANTAEPTNRMTGQVTSYNSGTGAMVVNVTATGGSGTFADWTISVTAVGAGGGVSPDSIVVLTSGTSWTCPAGVTKAVLHIGGAGGGGKGGNGTYAYGSGAAGGYLKAVIPLVAGTAYSYAIGAGGVGGDFAGINWGGNGGDTTFTANGVTYTARGGQSNYTNAGGTATGPGAFTVTGLVGSHSVASVPIPAPMNLLGRRGGYGLISNAPGDPGESGLIVLELYK